MKLVKVLPEPTKLEFWCNCCGYQIPDGEAYADTEGQPFRSYYCEQCKAHLELRDAAP